MKINSKYISAVFYGIFTAFIYYGIDKLNVIKNIMHIHFDDSFVYFVIVFLILVIMYLLIREKIIKGYISKSSNMIDYILTYLLIFSFLSIITNILCEHEYVISIFFSILLVILVLIRIIIKKVKQKVHSKKAKIEHNLLRLKDLYENEIPNCDLILIEEKEIDDEKYDLLDLSQVKNNLKRFIVNCNPQNSFVLGLIGEWGIGKSSTLRLVEQLIDNKDIQLHYFNPWKYANDIDLIEGFIEFISLKLSSNNEYDLELASLLKTYKNMIINMIDEHAGTNIFESNIISKDIEEEQKIINEYLKDYQEKFIFVVDNLDRISREQLHVFFSAINNLFNFNGIIFILCYDEMVISSLLTNDNEYNINFMDKIVNSKIYMPILDKNRIIDIGKKCITNLLVYNKIKIKYPFEYNAILSLILGNMSTLRELSRFINTLSLNISVAINNNLYINDFIVLEYIKFSNNDFYKSIYKNITIFFSDSSYRVEKKKENDIFAKYLENPQNIRLVNFLFKCDIPNPGYTSIYREGNDQKEFRASNYDLVSIYFSQQETSLLKINGELINIVEKINTTRSINYGDTVLLDLANQHPDYNVLDIFYDYLVSIKNTNNLIRILIVFRYNKSLGRIINYLVEKSSIAEVQQMANLINKHNKCLFILWLDEYFKTKSMETLKEKEVLLFEIFKEAISQYIRMPQTIFKKENYDERAYYVLIKRTHLETERIRKYLNKSISKENIFRILGSFVTTVHSSFESYSYIIEFAQVDKYLDIEKLKNLLERFNSKELTEDQRRVKTLYTSKSEKKYKKAINFNNI